jgi:hypothetical protein
MRVGWRVTAALARRPSFPLSLTRPPATAVRSDRATVNTVLCSSYRPRQAKACTEEVSRAPTAAARRAGMGDGSAVAMAAS